MTAYLAELTQPLTFAEFLAWDDGSGRDFELVDGFPMPIQDPNARHEDVVDFICDRLVIHCQTLSLPYVPKRSKQVKLLTVPGMRDRSRRADIVVFAKDEWERMRQLSSSAAAYIAPPMVVEVISQNWKEDYLTKLGEYEDLGIGEYWVVDYAALGAVRYIGSPKVPTISIYTLVEAEYQVRQFRGGDRLLSPTFPDLQLTADEIFSVGA